jgi:putative phosphoesterase
MSEPSIHRIGVLSDTHVPGRARVVPVAALQLFADEQVELILHAGDISTLAVLDQLAAYAPVEAVQGNVERFDVVTALPTRREIEVGGCIIGMAHDLGARDRYARTARQLFPSARVVVFGHSHIPLIQDAEGLLLLNPGSATDRRSQPHCTVATLTIAEGKPSARLIELP